ncbi:hypothetical protein G6F71_009021 [Rhizopus microsporus]|nr:hypothetical protein G6F71_009021 [Rhizopus microsporus]KAG1206139.1 hypothetical protein G6F69_009050 [Rhizopus microsporus]KAG1226300.1 hypothetical protein G6F67_009036 [Rhizopus microsporus]KAG1257808.1 hypothetical protein G6F68_009126 [Rhizopus microsporus]
MEPTVPEDSMPTVTQPNVNHEIHEASPPVETDQTVDSHTIDTARSISSREDEGHELASINEKPNEPDETNSPNQPQDKSTFSNTTTQPQRTAVKEQYVVADTKLGNCYSPQIRIYTKDRYLQPDMWILRIYTGYVGSSMLAIQAQLHVFFGFYLLLSEFDSLIHPRRSMRDICSISTCLVVYFFCDYFANMVVFGVQKNQFNGWCISKARKSADESLSIVQADGSNLQVLYSPTVSGSDLYNCTRLWENELKFGVVIFVILFVFYVHIAFCFWNFTQEKLLIRAEMMRYHFTPNPITGCLCEVILTCSCVSQHHQDIKEDQNEGKNIEISSSDEHSTDLRIATHYSQHINSEVNNQALVDNDLLNFLINDLDKHIN